MTPSLENLINEAKEHKAVVFLMVDARGFWYRIPISEELVVISPRTAGSMAAEAFTSEREIHETP